MLRRAKLGDRCLQLWRHLSLQQRVIVAGLDILPELLVMLEREPGAMHRSPLCQCVTASVSLVCRRCGCCNCSAQGIGGDQPLAGPHFYHSKGGGAAQVLPHFGELDSQQLAKVVAQVG